MSGRGIDLDLSLSGSQLLSARSTKSNRSSVSAANNRRPSAPSTSLHRPKAQVNSDQKRNNTASAANRHVTPRNQNQNQRHEESNPQASSSRGLSDDFLAFFESQGARPKVKNKSPAVKKKNTPGTMRAVFPGSAESTPRTSRSRQASTAASNETRHSIFRSETPLSVSTLDADDIELNSSRYSPVSTYRSNGISSVRGRPDSGDSTPRNNHFTAQPSHPTRSAWGEPSSPRLTDSATHPGTEGPQAVTSDLKHLNAANNMLSRKSNQSKPTKLELRTMQNSYQNPTYNVNKTPVNEIHSTGLQRESISKNQAEDYIRTVNMAASIIQHALRRFVRQRRAMRASEAAMKRLLSQKKEEMSQRRSSDLTSVEQKKPFKSVKSRQALQSRVIKSQTPDKDTKNASPTIVRTSSTEQTAVTPPVSILAGDQAVSKVKKSSNDQELLSSAARERKPVATSASPPDQVRSNRPNSSECHISPPVSARSVPGSARSAPNSARSALSISPSQSATRTTLEDLMSTLKQLEEEERLPTPPKSRTPRPLTPPTPPDEDMVSSRQTDRQSENYDARSDAPDMASAKLQNILSFLDEVETKDQLDSIYKEGPGGDGDMVEAAQLFTPLPGLAIPSAEEMEQMEQASAAASEVTSTVLKQRLQLEEKNRTVLMLQKALNQQRELTIRHAKETEKELSKRLGVQKSEYEETVQRHLNFIDQLIDDKKSLGDKCETLVTQMKQMEKKYSDKIRSMQETHDRELAKVKEMITTQEKVRREKWIDEKTKKIKDLTVKGLEPEIQRLINKHKSEIKKLKAVQEAELLASDERAGQRYVSMTEELRDQLAREKEAACQRERELAAQRYEKQLQAEEEAYQQTRRRLYQEIQDEKERLAEQAIKQKQDMDRLRTQLEETHSSSSNLLRREYEKTREENNRRHEAELEELRERLATEKEAWEQNYLKKQEGWMVGKEREVRESLRQERDREIDLVICRLEEDGQQAREECERAAENRIKRIREKYEKELEELERSERQAIEKYNSMKAELLEASGETGRLKVLNKQKEREVDDIKRLSEKLHSEREHVSDVVRQEFADKIVATNEENKRIKLETAEQRSQHKIEMERMKQEVELVNRAKQEEMDAVHSRVKQAIAKKDEVVQQLRQQHQAALKRADHLEGLLEQQRKQLLGGGGAKGGGSGKK